MWYMNICVSGLTADMNTGTTNTEKVLKTSLSRRTTVAQYLSSSSASLVEMTQSFCSYPHRTCMRKKLEGFDYCIRHILEDRNAPYRQCSYVSSRTGHKCSEAALKTEKRERFIWLISWAFGIIIVLYSVKYALYLILVPE